MKYFKIQTNRVKLKSIVADFGRARLTDECFFAPRPLPKQMFKFYIAFGCVCRGSKADQIVFSVKNSQEISELDFLSIVSESKYYWFAGDRSKYNLLVGSDSAK